MKNVQEDKAERVLSLYSRLRKGKIINKSDEAERFGVSLRTIQRDIADIQNFLQDQRHSSILCVAGLHSAPICGMI